MAEASLATAASPADAIKKVGIENTKEAIIAMNMLAMLMVDRFRDGVQVADAMAIWNKFRDDKEFHDALTLAHEGISQVNAEILDLDPQEVMTLVGVQLMYVPQILALLKTSKAA